MAMLTTKWCLPQKWRWTVNHLIIITAKKNVCAVFQWTCLRSERFVQGGTPRILNALKMARTNTMKIPASQFSMAQILFSTPSVWEVSSLSMCVSKPCVQITLKTLSPEICRLWICGIFPRPTTEASEWNRLICWLISVCHRKWYQKIYISVCVEEVQRKRQDVVSLA